MNASTALCSFAKVYTSWLGAACIYAHSICLCSEIDGTPGLYKIFKDEAKVTMTEKEIARLYGVTLKELQKANI